MHTQDDNNFIESLSSSSSVIMSDGLDLDLGVPRETRQVLYLGPAGYVCNVKRIKAYRADDIMLWEFDLEAPGLTAGDLIRSSDMLLSYDDEVFELSDEYEINLPDITSTLITFRGKRIVNNHE